ncbi:MAG: hypothetical protein NC097_06405 [Clostridium sp.]|nr:hypothetical protein [Prevotella sp.]MCM1429411.1 hypothetical protein [Clostridium sp.]MCM1475554.1 hypothetical protein [Muribaculaceae bacterium]
MSNLNHNSHRHSPFRVPDEYFSSFTDRMMAELPDYPQSPAVSHDRSIWRKLSPYLSLAAMFVGIWCMMKVFHVASQPSYSLDNPPAQVIAALNDPETYEYFSMSFVDDQDQLNVSDAELEDKFNDIYTDDEQFGDILGIELKPEYSNIVIKEDDSI